MMPAYMRERTHRDRRKRKGKLQALAIERERERSHERGGRERGRQGTLCSDTSKPCTEIDPVADPGVFAIAK